MSHIRSGVTEESDRFLDIFILHLPFVGFTGNRPTHPQMLSFKGQVEQSLLQRLFQQMLIFCVQSGFITGNAVPEADPNLLVRFGENLADVADRDFLCRG